MFMPSAGDKVNATPAQRPQPITLAGRLVTLVPLEPKVHGDSLYRLTTGVMNDELWRYLFDGPFTNRTDYYDHLVQKTSSGDAVFFAILKAGTIFSSQILHRPPPGTKKFYLWPRHAFDDLGYRRSEWNVTL